MPWDEVMHKWKKGQLHSGSKHGKKVTPQLVGWALHANKKGSGIPCHRVVNRNGRLAKNFAFGGWASQKQLLLAENISFSSDFQVDLAKHQFLSEISLTKALPQQKSLKENRPKPRL